MYIYIYVCVAIFPTISLPYASNMVDICIIHISAKKNAPPSQLFFPLCGAISGVSWLLRPALRKTMRCMSRSVSSCDLHLLVDTFGGSFSPDTSYKYV